MQKTLVSMLLADNSGAFPTGEVTAYAWPGGYPVFYLALDGETFCAACVNINIKRILDETLTDGGDRDWVIVGREVNWETPDMYCVNCNKRIESAYAEDDAPAAE